MDHKDEKTKANNNGVLVHIFFGLINIDHVKALLDCMTLVERVVIYEPDAEKVCAVGKSEEWQLIISDDRIILVSDKDKLENSLNDVINIGNAGHIGFGVITEYENSKKDELNWFIELVKSICQKKKIQTETFRFFKKAPCKNELYSLSTLNRNSMIGSMFESIEDKNVPVILVGAGPSLTKNVGDLCQAKGKAIIIAASHASRTVMNTGLVPDLTAEIDPDENYEFMKHDSERKCRMLLSAKVKKTSIEGYAGKCILFDFNKDIFALNCIQKQPENLDKSGSVITEVLDLFLQAGFKKFILAGMDLAFDEQGNTHSDGEKREDITGLKRYKVMGINGEMLESQSDWVAFRKHIEKRISSNPDVELIDATEGGALIAGSLVMSLKAAISGMCDHEYPVDAWLGTLPAAMSDDEMQIWTNVMRQNLLQLSNIEKILEKAESLSCQLLLMIRERKNGSEEFMNLCALYDKYYHMVLESQGSELLIYYCEDILQDYIQGALMVEKNGDMSAKLELECKMYRDMREDLPELAACIEEIYVRNAV